METSLKKGDKSMNETYKMTDAEIAELEAWCKENKEKAHSWVYAAIMQWIAEGELINNDDARAILEKEIKENRKDYDRLFHHPTGSWEYLFIRRCPEITEHLLRGLKKHLSAAIEHYKPLRDFEQKMLEDLSGDRPFKVLKEERPPGDFCYTIYRALEEWTQIVVSTSFRWTYDKDGYPGDAC